MLGTEVSYGQIALQWATILILSTLLTKSVAGLEKKNNAAEKGWCIFFASCIS